jgi:hypothetical protein
MKRKIQFLLGISFFALIFTGCNKEEWDPFQRPVNPEAKEYDLNDDQIIDFKLVYRNWTWDGAHTSGDMITGELVPENNNQVLLHQDLGLLFGQINDTVFNQVESPFLWETSAIHIPFLLSITSTNPTGWEKEWTTKNNVKKEFYYLSFKIFVDDKENLGWIRLKINNLTGQVEITDKQLTDQDHIIID